MSEGQKGLTVDRLKSAQEIAAINLGRKLNSYFGPIQDGAKLVDVLPAARNPASPGWEDILRGTDPIERSKAIRAIHVLGRLDFHLKVQPDLVSLSLREAGLDLSTMGGLRALSLKQIGRINGSGPNAALIISEAVRRSEFQQPQNIIQESHNRP